MEGWSSNNIFSKAVIFFSKAVIFSISEGRSSTNAIPKAVILVLTILDAISQVFTGNQCRAEIANLLLRLFPGRRGDVSFHARRGDVSRFPERRGDISRERKKAAESRSGTSMA